MAGVKISALPLLSSSALTDIYPTVQNNITYRVSLAQIAESLASNAGVRVATTAALTVTYNNGSLGVGATLVNAGVLAALSIDGIALSLNDRVLVKNQALTFQNGVYYVSVVGDGITAWVLTRSLDYDEVGDIDAGDEFTVAFGTVNGRTQWIETSVVAVIGTDAITFESNIVAGTGITKTNNTISLTVPVALINGGTNKAMVADNGAIVYSDADSLELLASTATAGQIIRSGASSAPSWSTATFASTYAVSTILYASSANVVTGLAASNRSVLGSSAAGVPNWLALTDGQLVIGSTAGAPAAASLTAGANITITPGSNSITIASSGNMTWTEVVASPQVISVNNGYIPNLGGGVAFSLPAASVVGDMFSIVGKAGIWSITQGAGQQIHVGATSTTVGAGGSLTAAAATDSATFVCIIANTTWQVVGGPQTAGFVLV